MCFFPLSRGTRTLVAVVGAGWLAGWLTLGRSLKKRDTHAREDEQKLQTSHKSLSHSSLYLSPSLTPLWLTRARARFDNASRRARTHEGDDGGLYVEGITHAHVLYSRDKTLGSRVYSHTRCLSKKIFFPGDETDRRLFSSLDSAPFLLEFALFLCPSLNSLASLVYPQNTRARRRRLHGETWVATT